MSKLIRSKRKTLAIEVSKQGELVVRAPLKMAGWRIERFLTKNEAWIERNLAEARAKAELARKKFEPGEQFLFLGERVPFEQIVGDQVVNEPRAHFKAWYRAHANEHILPRVPELASQHGYEYARVRLSNAKRTWGSCSGKNNIGISWRLIMAPPECIDYVIIHELVHTMHKHHGVWFWKRVERALPEYRTHRRWLRDNEHLLTI